MHACAQPARVGGCLTPASVCAREVLHTLQAFACGDDVLPIGAPPPPWRHRGREHKEREES